MAWQNLSTGRATFVGKLAFLLAGTALAVWAAVDAAQWWSAAPTHVRGFVAQRLLFSVVTTVNVPLLPLTAAGGLLWGLSKWFPPRQETPSGEQTDERPAVAGRDLRDRGPAV